MERRGGRRGRTDMLEQRLGRVPQPHAVDQLGLRAAGIAVRQQRTAVLPILDDGAILNLYRVDR